MLLVRREVPALSPLELGTGDRARCIEIERLHNARDHDRARLVAQLPAQPRNHLTAVGRQVGKWVGI